jgi:tRNA U38,U39,U40 pseudouridine synthase TruA
MSFQKLNQISIRTDNGVGTDGPVIKLVLKKDSRIEKNTEMNIESLLKETKGIIIEVRSRREVIFDFSYAINVTFFNWHLCHKRKWNLQS